MGNPDKRKKRSKAKAKLARVTKHEELTSKNDPQLVRISSEMVALFETLPSFSSTYDAVPYIRQFQKNINGKQFLDSAKEVAVLYAMYGHWTISGSDVIFLSELLFAGDIVFENPIFQDKFYSEFPLLNHEVNGS